MADLPTHGVHVCTRDLEDEYVRAIGPAAMWDAITHSGLFSSNELGNCAQTGPGGERTQEDVADFCRRKRHGYKVRAAIVAAETLDARTAAGIAPVSALLASVAGP
jgi:putative ATP-dependent endonuclease of the OLD family